MTVVLHPTRVEVAPPGVGEDVVMAKGTLSLHDEFTVHGSLEPVKNWLDLRPRRGIRPHWARRFCRGMRLCHCLRLLRVCHLRCNNAERGKNGKAAKGKGPGEAGPTHFRRG